MDKNKKICCFFGHRKITEADSLKFKLYEIIENLIVSENTETFLFGSKSEFDDLCRDVVTELKQLYPYIKRVYVRAEYPHISEDYETYLRQGFEETYFPENAINAGRAVYIKRNYEMIDKSDICIVYYKQMHQPKSGTDIAYRYAVSKKKAIINTAEQI